LLQSCGKNVALVSYQWHARKTQPATHAVDPIGFDRLLGIWVRVERLFSTEPRQGARELAYVLRIVFCRASSGEKPGAN
jgi:hypothetical protein